MMYLLDSNIFIQSRKELPMDIWVTFWQHLKELANAGTIFTSVKVKEEIDRGGDELPEWLNLNIPKSFYLGVNADVLTEYGATQNWAARQGRFTPAALADYAQVADAYLVATAKAKNLKLVTFEKSNPDSKKRVMIPDACDGIGAQYCDLNTMFRELHVII